MFPVAAVERGMVHDVAGGGAAREGVVADAAGDDGTFGEVADVFPAEGEPVWTVAGATSWALWAVP